MTAPLAAPADMEATRNAGMGAVSAAMVLFSVNNVLVGAMSISGPVTALYRLWLGAVALAVILWFTGRLPSFAVLRSSIVAGLAFGAGMWFLFTAFQTTSLANATIILSLQTGMTLTVVGPLFGERVRPGDIVLTAVATGGVALVVVGGESGGTGNLRGDGLALAGMLLTTAYFVLAKRARIRTGSGGAREYQLGLLLVAAVATVPVLLVLGEPPAGVTGWDMARLVLLAAGGTIGHLAVNWAHRHVPLKATSLLTLSVPVLSTILAWVALGERLAVLQMAGVAVTLAALAAVMVRAVTPASAPDAA